MKRDFKDLFNDFDYSDFDDDFMSLSDIDIGDDTSINIDVAKVKENVFKSIRNKNEKKHTRKSFRMLLIAAVLVIGITIFSTVIYASGSVQFVFGDFFDGNMASAELYNTADVNFTTVDPNLDVQLLGITGDKNKIYAVIEAKRLDGQPLTDEGFDNAYWWLYSGANINGMESHYNYYGCVGYCVDKNGDRIEHINGMVTYSLSSDRKNLKMLFMILPRGNDILGETMVIKSNCFGVRKITESIATKKTFEEDYNWDEIYRTLKAAGKKANEYYTVFNGECYEFCKTETRTYSLPFEMSFQINLGEEETIKRTLTKENAPNFITDNAKEVTMEITSFGINISGKCDLDVYENTNWSLYDELVNNLCYENMDPYNSKIVMRDGTEYYLYEYLVGEEGAEKGLLHDYYKETVTINFSDHPVPQYPKITVVDTRNIKSVIINGDIVYGE